MYLKIESCIAINAYTIIHNPMALPQKNPFISFITQTEI